MKPITDLLRKGIAAVWSNECVNGVKEFKYKVQKDPHLKHVEQMCQIIVNINTTYFAIGAALSQLMDG
jgi:hypothetical protein